jgi:predicted metallo-beta-lactamase superfamily hydrolase
MNKQF